MVVWAALGAENHWFAFQILDYKIDPAVVKEIAGSDAAAHLRNLKGLSRAVAHVSEFPISQVHKEKLWFPVL